MLQLYYKQTKQRRFFKMILETLLAIGLNPQPSYLNNIDFKEMEKEHISQINEYKTQNPIKSVYTKGNNVNLRNTSE